MDLDEFTAVLRSSGLDLWALIETAISVAARDHGGELRARRDGIVERLYTPAAAAPRCRSCGRDGALARPCAMEAAGERDGRIRSKGAEEELDDLVNHEGNRGDSPSTPQSPYREEAVEEEEVDDPVEDEQSKVIAIKDLLEDPDQEDESLVRLLQSLADMDLTFKALKETDIGRHVNRLRKHPSVEVRRLVKHLVRKWKDLVDDWVNSNSQEAGTSAIITDGDSPQQIQRINQNGNQVPDFGFSPNPHNGSSSSDKSNLEAEQKVKTTPPPRKEAPAKPSRPAPPPSPSPPAKAKEVTEEQKNSLLDPERLASARRRLHENYQEAQNAKKQRTIQVMDIHDIPKPKGSSGRNRGGFQSKHW